MRVKEDLLGCSFMCIEKGIPHTLPLVGRRRVSEEATMRKCAAAFYITLGMCFSCVFKQIFKQKYG